MSRIFVTGDKHGDYYLLKKQLQALETTTDDVVIILGDHGTLYYGPEDDNYKKNLLNNLPATFIMMRGNHDRDAAEKEYNHISVYEDNPLYSGWFYRDPKYLNLLYTRVFGRYRFGTKPVYVIGGAYSVDKQIRLAYQNRGYTEYQWFKDEQISPENLRYIKEYMERLDEPIYIFSHTAPLNYLPLDKFSPNIDQSTVDKTMEIALQQIEDLKKYIKWYCGHYHTDRTVDDIRFLYDDITLFDEIGE